GAAHRYLTGSPCWTSSLSALRGSATNHTGARPPPFQYFTTSSHSCCGGDGKRCGSGGMPTPAPLVAPPARHPRGGGDGKRCASGGIASPTHLIGRRRSNSSRRSIARTGGGDVDAA